jgi:hypothetical protein
MNENIFNRIDADMEMVDEVDELVGDNQNIIHNKQDVDYSVDGNEMKMINR